MQNEEWTESLGEAFGQQIALYNNMPAEKVGKLLPFKKKEIISQLLSIE